MKKTTLVLYFLSTILIPSLYAHAQTHKGISFQGVIKLPSGEAPTRSGVTVTALILTSNNCVVREESFSGVNLANGYLNIPVGKGSVGGYDPGLTMAQAMDNSKIIANGPTRVSGLICLDSNGNPDGAITSFNPASSDGVRKLRLSLTIDSTPILAEFNMRASAYAVNSESLNGKKETDFVNHNSGQGVTQTNIESIFSRFAKLDAILSNFNSSGNSLSASISGNAATATSAVTATNVTGTVAIANGGTGATSAADARTALGLRSLATMTTSGTPDGTKFLRDDGQWTAVSGAGGGSVTYGTASGTAAEGNDSRIVGAFQTSTTLTGGDLSGTLPAPTVARLNGSAVSSTVAGDDQKFMKYVHGSGWQPQHVKLSELKNAAGTGSAFNVVSCTASQTLVWSSITDQLACQDISLAVTKVTGLSTVATSGDYNDLSNKPTIPAAQVNSDWNASSGSAQILNKPTIPAAQVSSDWNASSGVAQVLNKPTLGTLAAKSAASLTADVSGTLPVANGGTGTVNGSITGTGALTFTAGGTNSNVNLAPTGTGTVDVSSRRISSVATPTATTDATTKAYVDAAVSAGGGGGKPKRVVTYTSGSGTFTPLEANSWIRVTLVGGGGGGAGGCHNGSYGPSGGGAGGAGGINVFYFMALQPSYNYSIGAAGIGAATTVGYYGSATSNYANSGAPTTFGGMKAFGGGAGSCVSGSPSNGVRGASNILGLSNSAGGWAGYFTDESSGLYGSPATAVGNNGGVGSGYGSGGGGAAHASSTSGGAGSGGLIIIEEFGAY